MKSKLNLRKFTFISLLVMSTLPMLAQGGQGPGGQGQRGQGPGGQGPGGGRQFTEEDVKQRVKRQSQALEMTEDQEKKIMDFEMEQYTKMQVERQKNNGDWEKMRESMGAQRDLRDQKYKEVLSEEQYNKYKQTQEERRKQMEERRQQNPGQPGTTPQGDRPDRGRGRG